ncbi:MAG: ATP-binding protein [Bacteroidetes bacterium]|nr:ATP-binding protein [Bacteroidota bacterium]
MQRYGIVLFALLQGMVFSQRLPVQSFTTNDGLASNLVTEIYQDSKGYLWIGTDEGISLFDGDQFRTIRFSPDRVYGYVNDIVESRRQSGVFWIATNSGGLLRYENGTMTTIPLGPEPGAGSVNSVLETADGALWCATDAGLVRFTQNGTEWITRTEHNAYTKLVRALDGTVWCHAGSKLLILDLETRLLSVPSVPGLPTDSIALINTLSDSSIAVHRGGRARAEVFIVRSMTVTKQFQLFSHASLFTVRTHDGQYWTGTPDGLTAMRDAGGVPFHWIYTTTNGLPINELTIGFLDKEENIWFGSYGRGLTKLETRRYTQFAFTGMSGKALYDKESRVWVPTSHGLIEQWKDSVGLWKRQLHVIRDNGTMISPVAVASGTSRDLWITAGEGVLYRLAVQRQRNSPSQLSISAKLTEADGYPRALNITLMMDSRDVLWYSPLSGGLIGIDVRNTPVKVAEFLYPRHTMLRDVRELHEDRDGRVWALGFDPVNRIVVRRNDRFELDSTDKVLTSLPAIPFRAVRQTADGAYWFGSRYQGLYLYQGDSLRRLTTADGLISNQIGSLGETASNGLLIGTMAGLMLMQDRSVLRFTSLQQYVQSPVVTLSSDSAVTFAATRFEMTFFDELPEQQESRFPPVLFTSISVNGKERPVATEVELTAAENTVTIDFTAISFRNSGALRFQYKLEPLEQSWSAVTSNRSVTYANLSPGEYVFSARVLNQQGIPNEIASVLPVSIASPYWTRWWFIAAVLSVILTILVLLERARVRRLLEIEKIRSRIAADLHDDIGSGLTRIALLSDMIRRQSGTVSAGSDNSFSVPTLTAKVGDISRELVDAMSDVVWSIDPKNSSMERLIQRVHTFAVEVCEAKEISLTFSVQDGVERARVGSDSIRAVLLVAKEALTNIVRHSNARNASFSIDQGQEGLTVTVKDDGKGFTVDELSRMNGLTNMRLRVEKLGGVFTLDAVKGAGTTVVARIPLGR